MADNGEASTDPFAAEPAEIPTPIQPPADQPAIDLDTARAVLLALVYAANTRGTSPERMESLVHQFAAQSGAPTRPDQLMDIMAVSREQGRAALERPWHWCVRVAHKAEQEGRFDIPGICLWWAHNWTRDLQPRFGPYERTFYLVADVPTEVRNELRSIATSSMPSLPPDFVLFGDQTGQVTAAWIGANAHRLG